MKNTISYKDAIASAVKYADLSNNDPRCANVLLSEGVYELEIDTPFQHYDFYVDSVSGEILGINCEPYMEIDGMYWKSIAC